MLLLMLLWIFSNNYFLFYIFLIIVLAETNRVPFDLPEAESVAGFITEYCPIYFSLILLTEYANIICFILFIILIFNLFYLFILWLFLIIGLIRSIFVRIKFDELITNAWIVIPPIISSYLIWCLLIIDYPWILTNINYTLIH